MLKKNYVYWIGSGLAMALSACSWLKQDPAPTQSGTDGSYQTPETTATPGYDNTAPYTPGVAAAQATAVVPQAAGQYASVDVRAASHTVVKGDTVYNIAKRYQITQEQLRSWNSVGEDNNISLGQTLRVKPAGYVAPAVAAVVPAVQQPAVTVTPVPVVPAPVVPASTVAVPAKPAAAGATRSVSGIEWQRPTAGKVLQEFSGSTKGIDIGGTLGQPIYAAADGKVVYSGSGLRGYGNLIILQHNQTYLTAYSHNQSLLVKENQQVKRGQQIATMGNSDAKRTQLHFELRENGTPMDPSRFLPM
ncbi:peptidoglycan DD-metalloendopeptidase family protein [Stenoxybacter acetivorans]|uniref:peptidoglycan DD-metalloendopeptidase family protein n=1 Tax=Stenoxybacter acetivorans TaxID=422441 RepID=UPI00056A9D3C|nr:peptidoglycan DD-metalloendopeptidase family protein [Stenoxybacter acetivorans]